jgi:hypothetical protein
VQMVHRPKTPYQPAKMTLGGSGAGSSFSAGLHALNGEYVEVVDPAGRTQYVRGPGSKGDDLAVGNKFGPRRYLWWSTSERAWVVAATCNDSEGYLAVCPRLRPHIGDDPEPTTWFPLYDLSAGARDEAELAISLLSAEQAAADFGVTEFGEQGAGAEVAAVSAPDAAEYLADLLPWEGSNHDALLFTQSG